MPQVQEVGELFAVPIKWEDGGLKQSLHINALEMMAILYALKSFKGIIRGRNVQVLTDNTCAVSLYPTWEDHALQTAMTLQSKSGCGAKKMQCGYQFHIFQE